MTDQKNINTTNNDELCYPELDFTNLCPQETKSIDDPDKIVGAFIEIDPVSNYKYVYEKGNSVTEGDTIGELNGIKIESPVSGVFNGFNGNVAVVIYNDNTAEEIVDEVNNLSKTAIEKLLNTDEQNDVQDIIDGFEKLNNIKTVLREYVLYCKLPSIPIDLSNTSKPPVTIDIIYNDLIKKHDDMLKQFQDDTERICGKDHIEEVLNGPDADKLKDEIMEYNDKFYSSVFDAYKTYLEGRGYSCSQYDISSHRLINYYLDIKDKITPDDKNEYIIELVGLIDDFISRRNNEESNVKIDYLDSINAMCNISLKAKWNFAETYVDKFNKIYNDERYKDKKDPLYSFLEDLMIGSQTNQTKEELDAIKLNIQNIYTEYQEYSQTMKRLETETRYEYDKMNKFFNKLESDYNKYVHLLDDSTFDKFKKIIPSKKQNLYYDGKQYEHYYFSDEPENIPLMDEENRDQLDLASSSLTSVKQFGMLYWIKYCIFATITHCAQPTLWPCGIIAAGEPIKLPVIYVPIYYLGGNVGCLFGLGICGMFIWPMILCVNFNVDARTILLPINMLIDLMRSECNKLIKSSQFTIKDMAKMKADNFKKEYDSYDQQIAQIEAEILKLKQNIGDIGKARKQRKIYKKNKKQKTEG